MRALTLSYRAQFTKIAVDWMVHAADDRYYDVMFVGTGKSTKSIHKYQRINQVYITVSTFCISAFSKDQTENKSETYL